MIRKALYITLIITTILIAGCTSVQQTTVTETPTPVTAVPTFVETPTETVGPTPTETVTPVPTSDLKACFDKNITTPDYCYDYYYWVRPTVTPVGMGYTARVWQNNTCVDMNRTSNECEQWGDDTWTAIFLHNLTVVRNLTGINMSEVIAATAYYNNTYDLATVNGATYDSFIKVYWDGTYPSTPYDKSEFVPDKNVSVIVVNATFDPNGF